VTALGVAVAVGLVADGTAAKKKRKERITARVNGKRFRAQDFNTSGSDTAPLVIKGGTKPRVGTVVRSVEVWCKVSLQAPVTPHPPDPCTGVGGRRLAAADVPADCCFVRYYNFRFGGADGGTTRRFRGSNDTGAVQVTLESFDGSRLTGTFQGTLGPVDASKDEVPIEGPSVTVENGTFSVILDD
jgi:hypothetical protein